MIRIIVRLRCTLEGFFSNVKVRKTSFNRRRLIAGLDGIKGTKEYPTQIRSSLIAGRLVTEYGCRIIGTIASTSNRGVLMSAALVAFLTVKC